MRKQVLLGIAGSLASLGFATMAVGAGPDVVVTDAKIEAGKLVITGQTAAGGTRVRLDGRAQPDFNTVSGSDKSFRFSLVYLPKDCIVSLQKVQGAQLGAATDAIIANCSPSAITPRGSWSEKTAYDGLDLVSHGGASWLAVRSRARGVPGKSADWQLFAGKGSDGKSGSGGSDGSPAAAGVSGTLSPAVPSGAAGGDLSGTYPNPTIATGAVTTNKIGAQAVTAGKIKDGAINGTKIVDGAVKESKIADGAVTAAKIALGTITGAQIANETITAQHLATDSVNATEIANDSIDSGEIVDFGLSNEDIGVLGAQVNADGTIAQAQHAGTTSFSLGTGTYEVDFALNVSACVFIATQGEAGIGGAAGAIMGVTDRSGNANAVFVTARDAAGALVNTAFHLLAVC